MKYKFGIDPVYQIVIKVQKYLNGYNMHAPENLVKQTYFEESPSFQNNLQNNLSDRVEVYIFIIPYLSEITSTM